MTGEDYPGPFFRITEKETGKSVRICFGNFLLDGFMRNFRRGSIRELLIDIFLKRYNGREIEEEIKQFKVEVFELVYFAKNRVYMSHGNGIRDGQALEDTFKLNIYTGMALWELSDVFLKIVAKDRGNKFSSETERAEEVENEISKVRVKLVNSILDLIHGEYLPPENVLKELEIPEIRKLQWLRLIICASNKCDGYCDREVKFKRGEIRKYDIPANMDTKIIIKRGLKNKKGPQAVVGIEGAGETKLEKEFYLFGDFTSRRIGMLKKRIDKMFDKIVKQKDDPVKIELYKIELSNLRDELVLIAFDIEGEIKKIRRDYKGKLNFYGEYILDENAIEVSKILHIKFIELIEDMRVLLFKYVNGGIKVEDLIIGYLEKRVALRKCVAEEILKVDLSKCSVLDFINNKIGEGEFDKLSVLKIDDSKLEEARNSYIREKKRLEKYVSEEILRKGSVFDHLYVKFKGTDKYFNPHDDFLFPGEQEKHLEKIKEIAEEKAKKEKDRNKAYKEACEEAIRETMEEKSCDEEISFSEQLNHWKLDQKLLSPPDPERVEKEWQAEITKARKEMPPDKGPSKEDININIPGFTPTVAEEFINYGNESFKVTGKSFKIQAESIHRIVVGVMEGRSRLTASRYINFIAKLEDSKGTDEKEYAQKVIELVEKVRPTESELREYINNITVGEVERFLYVVSLKTQPTEEDRDARKLKLAAFKEFSESFKKIIRGMRKSIEKIKSVKGIHFKSLINEEDIESAIKSAKEELEKLK